MRFLIVLTPDLAIVLEKLAQRDHRSVRQEAEWILHQAIQQAAKEQQCAHEAEVLESAYVPARS
jgi:predicted transcriptional regulator